MGVARRFAFVAAAAAVALTAPAVSAPRSGAASACSLLRAEEVARTIARPANLKRGSRASECVVRAGQLQPIIVLVAGGGKQAYRNVIRATGAPTKRLTGVGTEAVTYDHVFDTDLLRTVRGVVVRKDKRVLHVSTSSVGDVPFALPTVRQLVALTKLAVRRL